MKNFLSNIDPINRRRFVEYLAKTMLGVSVLPSVARSAMAAPAPSASASTKGGKKLIYLFMQGAMSHMDTFDLKPGHENQGSTRGIATSVPGLQISEHLPTLASQMQHIAAIRSMTTLTADHEQGTYLMRTSYKEIATERHPSLGPWMQKFRGRQNKSLPDTVLIGAEARHPSNGFFDPTYSPLPIGDPNRGLENTTAPEYLKEDEFDKRMKLIDGFDKKFRDKFAVRKVQSYTDYYAEAVSLLTSGELKAFNLNEEKPADRERYGNTYFGQGCLLARRLIEANVQCVEVMFGGWDMHQVIFADQNMPQRGRELDRAVGNLIKDLSERGLLKDTVIALTSEFGRTPKINYNSGRDHHPAVFSSFLAGGGIKGGQLFGRSDASGSIVEENPVYPADFNATIATALGLPTDQIVHSPSGRPFKVAHDGNAVRGVLS